MTESLLSSPSLSSISPVRVRPTAVSPRVEGFGPATGIPAASSSLRISVP